MRGLRGSRGLRGLRGMWMVCTALLLAASLLAVQPLLPSSFDTVAGADEADELVSVFDTWSETAEDSAPLEETAAQEPIVAADEAELATEASQEGNAPMASEASQEGDAPAATEASQEGDAPMASEASQEGDAPAATEASQEGDAPAAAEASQEGNAPADEGLELGMLREELDGYVVSVEGMLPRGARLTLARVSDEAASALLERSDTEGLTSAFAADITIVDAEGHAWQPGELDVRVSIENLELDDAASYAVVHVLDDASAIAAAKAEGESLVSLQDASLAAALPEAAEAAKAATGAADTLCIAALTDGLTLEDGTLSFDASSFSVYIVVRGSVDPHVRIMSNLVELESNCGSANGFRLSYDSDNYVTNGLNGNGAFVVTKDENAASTWYFERVDDAENEYRIFTYVNGTKKYVHQKGSGNNLELSESTATVFVASCPDTTQFVFKVADQSKWLQYSVSGGGIRLFTNPNNTTNCYFTLTYATPLTDLADDYYQLSGKKYSLVFHEESVMAAGLTTTTKTISGKSDYLAATELVVRPNVLSSGGELLIDRAADLPEWTFHAITGTKVQYYVTTNIGGTTHYLTLNGTELTLETTQSDAAKITVTAGSGENAGKYRLSVGNYALTLTGTTGSNEYFSSSKSGGSKSWMSLATKTELETEDFNIYSAEKVNLSDNEQVKNGDKVVVYTRVWNSTTKKYEFYAINFDGSLIRCYESGDMIQWVGSTVDTAEWIFTEYTDASGSPTYYYELKNDYSGKCLRPSSATGSATASILRDPSVYDYTELSVNINGRRYGYYYSTILAWDDDSYAYLGLRANASRSAIEACAMGEASSFYFAKLKDTTGEGEPDTVKTIDHTEYGITMKMVDLENGTNNDGYMTQLLKTGSTSLGYKADEGLLSTNLEANGYPTITKNSGHSLAEMFSETNGVQEVNHLFIENTYYSSGYYEFDSTQNFAALDKTTNNFTVYSDLGTNDTKSGATMKHGQFLPYNTLSATQSRSNPENLYDALAQELPDSNPRKGEPLYLVQDENGKTDNSATDYYFGVEIEASFTQTENGHDAWGHDIIYEFTGDDDFWLYVDGELIIDLGGIHSALAGSVNYCTGEVVVNGKETTLREIFASNYRKRGMTEDQISAKLAEIFEQNEAGNYVFKDYTTHTMRIFYLERGRGASNLHMRFNLASVKPGTVELTKQVTGVDNIESFMADYYFQIYWRPAQSTDGSGEEEPWRLLETTDGGGTASSAITVKYKDSSRNVAHEASHTFYGDGTETTYENVFLLKPGETAVIDFPDDTFQYYIRECYVNTEVYSEVQVNGTNVTGEAVQANSGGATVASRKDFASTEAEVDEVTRVTFANVVNREAKGTLTITNKLFKEDGVTELTRSQELNTTFTFRLYLGTENTADADLAPADMHSYHVKDESGNYCTWDKATKSFVSTGKTSFDTLTDAEQAAATFTTSMNGSISNIPVGYVVEVREISYGTKYKVEERLYEIPDGYSLQQYKSNARVDFDHPKVPVTGVIGANTSEVEIDNIKGWGLRVYKTWTDAAYMEDREDIYLALFTKGDDGALTMVDGSVLRLAYGEESAYWFIAQLGSHDFGDYVAREVILTGDATTFEIDEQTNLVTGYGEATPIGTGAKTDINGTQTGESSSSSYEYKVLNYTEGETADTSNIRRDTLTNKRAGIDVYLYDFAGVALAGGEFTLVGGGVTRTFTAGEDGLITVACLKTGVDYTFTQTASPAGYLGMQGSLTITRTGETTFTVSGTGVDTAYYDVSTKDYLPTSEISYGKLTIKNKPFTLQVKAQFVSEGSDPKPLAGIKYTIYRQVVNSATGQAQMDFYPVEGYENLTTDSSGLIQLIPSGASASTLPAGTYYLHQVEPPSIYKPLERDVVFSVSATGVVSLVEYPSGAELSTSDTEAGISNTILISYETFGTQTLTVTNTVVNGTTADTNGTNKFAYEVQLYMPDGRTPWSYSGEGFADGRASFSLGHNGTKALSVPVNARVIVTQNEILDYATTYSANNGSSTGTFSWSTSIASGENQRIDYTNTRQTTKVTVTKKVVGATGSFTFTAALTDSGVECVGYTLYSKSGTTYVTDSNGTATFTLSPASANGYTSVTLTIPYGSQLTVTEADCSDSYDTKVTKSGTTAVSRQAQFTAAETKTTSSLSVTFTNTAKTPIVPSAVKRVLAPAVLCLFCGGFLASGYAATAQRKRHLMRLREGGAKR